MPWAYIRTKDKFNGPMFEGAYIREEKRFNLQSVKLTFLSFFKYKHVFRHFSRRASCEICSQLTIKTPVQ